MATNNHGDLNKLNNWMKRGIYQSGVYGKDWFQHTKARLNDIELNLRNLVSKGELYAVVLDVQQIKREDLGLHSGCGTSVLNMLRS